MEPIPREVVAFIDKAIDCVEQLELLRVLAEEPEKRWSALELARVVQVKPDEMESYLKVMKARGLISLSPSDNGAWHHGPLPSLEAVVNQLLDVYRERPVTMIRLVYDRAAIRLRAFANAFRLQGDEEE